MMCIGIEGCPKARPRTRPRQVQNDILPAFMGRLTSRAGLSNSKGEHIFAVLKIFQLHVEAITYAESCPTKQVMGPSILLA